MDENSPFSNTKTYGLYLEPILDTQLQTYLNVLTVDNIPDGPLKNLVKTIKRTNLSQFQTFSSISITNPNDNCVHILCRYPSRTLNKYNSNNYMFVDDIPSVISYLTSNGYKVDTKITKMLNDSSIILGSNNNYNNRGNKKLLFLFTINI